MENVCLGAPKLFMVTFNCSVVLDAELDMPLTLCTPAQFSTTLHLESIEYFSFQESHPPRLLCKQILAETASQSP